MFFPTDEFARENVSAKSTVTRLRALCVSSRAFEGLLFSLSLSFAARVERMLRMSFRAGFPFPFPFRGRAFFLFLLFFFLSPLGWFSPPLGGRLHHPEESLFVRVDARGSFIGSNGGSSDGMRHHHQYEYREHAFVGYTEKTKKTKKKCTDAVQMCGSWAQAGECEKNREYMFENCCCGAS
jgi:hypothetical protein